MDFDNLVRISASWAPPIFGAVVGALTAANIWRTFNNFRHLEAIKAKINGLESPKEKFEEALLSSESIIQDIANLDQLEESILTRLSQAQTISNLDEIQEIEQQLEAVRALRSKFINLQAQFDRVIVEREEMDAKLAKLKHRVNTETLTVNGIAVRSWFSLTKLALLVLKLGEYVGNVSARRTEVYCQ